MYTMATYKKSVSILFMIAVTLSEAARKVKDCEVIRSGHIQEPGYSTFNDNSIQFSILNDVDTWKTSALISDNYGKSCMLTLERLENSIKEELNCTGVDVPFSSQSAINRLMNNTWIEISLETENIPITGSMNRLRMKLIVEQPVYSKIPIFDTKSRFTPLQWPLKIQWKDDAQVDLVSDCQKKDCLEFSRTLIPNPDDPKKSFFVQQGDKFEGLNIILEPSYPEIESLELPDNGNGWRNIILTVDMDLLKILIDGEELANTSFPQDSSSQFEIKSVQLRGNGLLTWCEPMQLPRDTPDNGYNLRIGLALGGVLIIVVIIIIIILVVYICCKHSKSEERLELTTPSSPAHVTDRATMAPPTGGVPSPYAVEDVSETIPELREGNRGSSHDSENSIYEAYVP